MYACIDLGSNSFHLLIGEWRENKIDIVERYSEKVQLGEGVRVSGLISEDAFARGLVCLCSFNELIQQYPVKQYWALGTNTFRNVANATQFVTQAKHQANIDISIISGVQEAVLIYAGVLSSQVDSDEQKLVIDIGGGSTEIIIGKGQHRQFTDSFQIGSVAWRDTFIAKQAMEEQTLSSAMDKAKVEAAEVFSSSANGVKRVHDFDAFASSGTGKMLAAVCEHAGGAQGVIDLAILHRIKTDLVNSIIRGDEILGVKERRRDLLLGSWAIMMALMESYDLTKIHYSSTALREGMLHFMVKNKSTLAVMENTNLPAVSNA